jgi:hypothetical protein
MKMGNLIIVPEEAEIIKRIYRNTLKVRVLVGDWSSLEKDGIFNRQETKMATRIS